MMNIGRFGLFLAGALVLVGCMTSEGEVGYQAMSAGNYSEAREHLEKAIAASPNDPYVQLNLGATYQNLGEYALAREYLTKVLTSGANMVPERVSTDGAKNKTLGDIARMDLAALPH